MSAEENIKTIQRVYEAFGRGDVATILDLVTDDVDWASEGVSTVPPWYGPRHGKEQVGAFFQSVAEAMDVQEFTPLTFATNDTDVLTVVKFAVTARATGRSASMNLHHWFTFRDGKIAHYRGSEDTAQTVAVLQD
jgi:ketosteroid isomerase-like protein